LKLSRTPLAFLLLALSAGVSAQTKNLTIEAIYGGELSAPAPSEIRWMPDGRLSFFFPSSSAGRDLLVFDPATGERRILVPTAVLRDVAPSPSEAGVDEREYTRRTRFGVPDYHWSPDGTRLLFTSTGKLLVHEIGSGTTTRLAPDKSDIFDPKFSPDGKQIAFVHEHDLWVASLDGGVEKQITFGGTDLILHGELDWVYPEELGVRTGYHWSPDSRYVAFLELDETLVPTYPIVDEVSRQATVDLQRYPKPGDPNPRVRVGFVSVETGRTAWIDRAAEYVPRIQWVDERRAAVQLLNRGQDELELVLVDPESGRSRSAAIERNPHWINVNDDLVFLKEGERFLWTSERTGFRHVYLFEKGSSRPLTEGAWEVSEIEGVDSKGGFVYFTANRDNPIGGDLFRVKIDGSGLERLTGGGGTHAIDMNPEATVYLDDFSAMNDPGRTVVRSLVSGREHPFHEEKSLSDYALVPPEYRLLDAPDGAKVGLLLLKPKELEPGRKYPLVAYVYGMPGFATIQDSWGGNRHLFHQFLVQKGFVVAQIDDRTSAIRGHKYAVLGDHDIGPVAVQDHEVAVEYLTSLPYIDSEHTAVWGWSGGGFTTTFHMTHTKLFHFGIAGAPVTDWHLYDSIYTERYMGLPQDDPEAYRRTSSIEGVENYSGRLLLIHGSHDDNVHPQNTMKLIDALIKKRRQFDLVFYPNETHGIRGTDEVIHLWTLVYEYLERNLRQPN
jgi:dipeptidyl-peptidase-4